MTENTLFEVGGTYETRDGHKVRIYATDGGRGGTNIHGAIKSDDDRWYQEWWEHDGRCVGFIRRDLVVPKKRVWVLTYWYKFSGPSVRAAQFSSRTAALQWLVGTNRILIDLQEAEVPTQYAK